ncbi:hypothetical protein B0H12DRAFT_1077672 [Mycena haematopus]|nr:hypothetical protein B0H12DRAFT_1077672 [Mycena haematopus]
MTNINVISSHIRGVSSWLSHLAQAFRTRIQYRLRIQLYRPRYFSALPWCQLAAMAVCVILLPVPVDENKLQFASPLPDYRFCHRSANRRLEVRASPEQRYFTGQRRFER